MAVGTGVYKVSGRNEIFILENDVWRYVPTEQALFDAGYSWADVQEIPIAEWCGHEVGYPMPTPGWRGEWGYYPHKDWYTAHCATFPPPPPPPPPETLKCPICDMDLGIVGLRVEVLQEGPIVARLRKQIAALDARIAELKDLIAAIRAQIDGLKQELGVGAI